MVIQYILTRATQDGDPFNLQEILSNVLQYLSMQSNLAFNNQYKLFVLVSLQQYQWINAKLICLFCCFEYKTWVVHVYTCTWS